MSKAVSFPILLHGGAGDHAQRLLELELLVLDPPGTLLVKLLGPGGIHPTAALAFLDLLSLLPDATKRAVISYGHLLGAGDLAFWLECAPQRDIRPRATVYVERTMPALAPEQVGSGQILIAPFVASLADGHVLSRDFDICLSLISRHVDLDSTLNRVLTSEDLREMLLIDSYSIDRLFSAPVPEASRIPNDTSAAPQRGFYPGEEKHRADQ